MRRSIDDSVPTLGHVELEVRKAQLSVHDLSEAAIHLDNAGQKLGALLNEIEPLAGELSDEHAISIEVIARVLAGIRHPADLNSQANRLAASLRQLL